jgi:hypothetical protein
VQLIQLQSKGYIMLYHVISCYIIESLYHCIIVSLYLCIFVLFVSYLSITLLIVQYSLFYSLSITLIIITITITPTTTTTTTTPTTTPLPPPPPLLPPLPPPPLPPPPPPPPPLPPLEHRPRQEGAGLLLRAHRHRAVSVHDHPD